MYLYSTNQPDHLVALQEAVLQGLPADNGLYMPQVLTPLPAAFWENWRSKAFADLAFELCQHLLAGYLPEEDLHRIVHGAVNFDAPIHSLDEKRHVLELFHGPTLAFKDFGARFMARLMGHFSRNESRTLHILVATSGDTGGAVAAGFWKTPGIEVIILYPSGKVSELQEKQLTTLGHNITALEIDGTFDDCQGMVKQAFLDEELRGQLLLSSANSINIARLIPQMFYYFRAFQQLPDQNSPVVVSIPSGNFGNLTAGLLAQRLGLPIAHFIAATNRNDIVPAYLETGTYAPRASEATISNAMDVGNPSNFARMQDLFGGEWEQMKAAISGYSYTDEETSAEIQRVFQQYGYVMDPHGAVGQLALEAHLLAHPDQQGIVLETAHPAKFGDSVEAAIGQAVVLPEGLARLQALEKVAIPMSTRYADFRTYLLGRK
jgi:threonine synthase